MLSQEKQYFLPLLQLQYKEYVKKAARTDMKSLPIGISDYVRAQSEYYYVDKTLLIKEFLDQKPLVSLFTRPRRFGNAEQSTRCIKGNTQLSFLLSKM